MLIFKKKQYIHDLKSSNMPHLCNYQADCAPEEYVRRIVILKTGFLDFSAAIVSRIL
jgi:hypothetical protein